jgi:hypothetical protein
VPVAAAHSHHTHAPISQDVEHICENIVDQLALFNVSDITVHIPVDLYMIYTIISISAFIVLLKSC